MWHMARSARGSPQARALGAELRECRQRAKRSIRQLAHALGTHHMTVSRYETGDAVPDASRVADYLTALGVSDAEHERILALAHEVGEPNWLTSGVPGVEQQLTTLLECERSATAITDVSPLLVPGLLQTADYTRTVMSGISSGETEKRVMLRLGRRDTITKPNGPQLTAVIAEEALQQPTGGHSVMGEQLRHLLKMDEEPNISVRVLPGREQIVHPAHAGPFVLYEFAKAAPIVHLEHYSSAAFLYGMRDVEAYREAVATLRELALPQDESRTIVEYYATHMETQQ
ncbi:helix-turn-helix transcriptional regulator [Actinopolyspora halophila]|uniref:helix-turn-helix domain-containing protein n=1 Tax=Actinopolyspora halophila TaxID=1850 RepID=UPI00316AEBCC